MKKIHKLLIVEDEPDIVEFLTYHFTKNGFRVLSARDGEKALQALEYFRPNIIISDILMPVMDGIKMCKQLKNDSEYADIPIIFLSGVGDDYRVLSAIDAGGDQFLSKPFAISVLTRMVNQLLEKKGKIFL